MRINELKVPKPRMILSIENWPRGLGFTGEVKKGNWAKVYSHESKAYKCESDVVPENLMQREVVTDPLWTNK